MKKTAIAAAVTLAMGVSSQAHAIGTTVVFDMYDGTGALINTDTAVTGFIETGAGTWGVASTVPFNGELWNAHDGTLFTSTFTVDAEGGGTPRPSYTGVQVGAGQIGGHILFDWGAANASTNCGKANCNIDVINVWDVTGDGSAGTTYISIDVTGNRKNLAGVTSVIGPNGTPGLPMIDGAFPGFSANFDMTATAIPVPAAVWLFGSGLMGLVGVARRRRRSA